jgi:hypothetical protein
MLRNGFNLINKTSTKNEVISIFSKSQKKALNEERNVIFIYIKMVVTF